MSKAGKSSGGRRKIGRNIEKCKKYKGLMTREANKRRKAAKHVKHLAKAKARKERESA